MPRRYNPQVQPDKLPEAWEEIPGSENKLAYECKVDDVGRRVRVIVTPTTVDGQVCTCVTFQWSDPSGLDCFHSHFPCFSQDGTALQATTYEVFCSPPRFRGVHITTSIGLPLQTRLSIVGEGGREASEMPIIEGGRVVGHPKPGMTLKLHMEYVGGYPSKHVLRWLSVKGEGNDVRSLAEDTTVYTVLDADIGRQIAVEMVPCRADGEEGSKEVYYTRPVSWGCCFSR